MTMQERALMAIAFGACALGACEGVLPEPDFERMLSQRSYRAYEAAPTSLFADGRAMRPPPAGTISRDRILGAPALTSGVEGGRFVARIPIPVDRPLLERRRNRFEIFCAACHGVRGDGRSPVANHMELRKPPSLVAPPVTTFPPGRIYSVVELGYGLMPGYASDLPVRDRWATVAYLRALGLSQGVPLADLPVDVRAPLERGLP